MIPKSKLESAAKTLHEKLKSQTSFIAVGIGQSVLFVYVNSSLTNIPEKWKGFSVTVREVDNPTGEGHA